MRVGLNLHALVPAAGGVGRYMTELTAALATGHPEVRLTAFHSSELPAELKQRPWAAEIEWVRIPVSVTHGPPGNILLTLGSQWLVQPALARRRRLDVIHGPAYIAPLAGLGARTVVTIPDLIYTRYPDLLDRRTRLGMRLTVGPVARRADRVIAISQTCAADVAATLSVPRSRIDVTLLGATPRAPGAVTDEAALRARHRLADAPVVLCVAQKRPHKNLRGLIEAIELVPRAARLVLVGFPTPHEDELRAVAGDRVRFVGWIDEAELEGLYALASCCCLASFEEGFGLPVLEAMARELPVACSDAGALAEVAGSAAELFDPRDPAAIAAAAGARPRRRGAARAAARGRARPRRGADVGAHRRRHAAQLRARARPRALTRADPLA